MFFALQNQSMGNTRTCTNEKRLDNMNTYTIRLDQERKDLQATMEEKNKAFNDRLAKWREDGA